MVLKLHKLLYRNCNTKFNEINFNSRAFLCIARQLHFPCDYDWYNKLEILEFLNGWFKSSKTIYNQKSKIRSMKDGLILIVIRRKNQDNVQHYLECIQPRHNVQPRKSLISQPMSFHNTLMRLHAWKFPTKGMSKIVYL